MDRVFRVHLYADYWLEEPYTDLDLPASDCEMLDALDKMHRQGNSKLNVDFLDCGPVIFLAEYLREPDLNDLNTLAKRISTMNEGELVCFEGLVQIDSDKHDGRVPLPRLIDLAHSVDCCIFMPDVENDKQLGRYYANNDLIPEIRSVKSDAYEFLDFEQLGRKARERDGGVFVLPCGKVKGSYVALDGEIREVYKTLVTDTHKPDYAIRLELWMGEEPPQEGQPVTLRLPASPQEMDHALDVLGAMDWDEVSFRCADCQVPALIQHIGAGDNIAHVNRLAGRLAAMDAPTLVKYKAVLDATEDYSVLGATHIAVTLRDYLYEPKYAEPEDMARDFLENSMGVASRSLIPFVDLAGYGQKLLEEQQGAMTKYGMVCREDGQCLKTSLTPTAPLQRGMEGMKM